VNPLAGSDVSPEQTVHRTPKGPIMKKALLVALALVVASLGLVACGGDDDTSDTGAAETQAESTTESGGGGAEGGSAGSASVLDFETPAGTDLAYTTEEAEAAAGKVTVNFTNVQAIPHDVDIEDSAGDSIGKTDLISEDSASAKVDLEPGTYTFFCSVPGHREAGMEGTINVK
jgi:plastocyanin